MGKKVIGIDYGTLSARAVILDVDNGEMCGTSTYEYPHGVIEDSLPKNNNVVLPDKYALASHEDYNDALVSVIKNSIAQNEIDASEIVGIGIDATTYTMVPCDEQGNVMCTHDKYKNEPMAYIKLWKHHAAIPQADKIQEAHDKTRGFPAVVRYGGKVNCEWALPKLLETYELAPDLFNDTYKFVDLGEWLIYLLSDTFTTSIYSHGFKCMWTPEFGNPTKEGLNYVAPGFADLLDQKFWGKPISHFKSCATLSKKMAETLGLNEGINIAGAMGDGTIPGVYFCLNNPKTLALTYGTSIAMSFLSEELHEISGLNGVVKDGVIEGYYGYDAGQPCAGDMLNWFVKSVNDNHINLTELAQKNNPWENKLTVLDWWNGNRGILNDLSLRGAVMGYSLNTKNSDIYCAMLQGIACGNKRIIDHLKENGIEFDKIVVCGGISKKNKFAMQQYANILAREVYVSKESDVTARCSAILGAFAAGYDEKFISEHMINLDFDIVKPDVAHAKNYANIYKRWCKFHDLLSKE